MYFLIDENLPPELAQVLEEQGHDVLDVRQSTFRGAADEVLWELASAQRRIIITQDRDFLVFDTLEMPLGLILVRVPSHFTSQQTIAIILSYLNIIPVGELIDRLIVITPGRVRSRRLGPLLLR